MDVQGLGAGWETGSCHTEMVCLIPVLWSMTTEEQQHPKTNPNKLTPSLGPHWTITV